MFGEVRTRDSARELKLRMRSRGRPKRRFMDCIEEDLKIKGLEVTDAEDRDLWRRQFEPATLTNQELVEKKRKNICIYIYIYI